MWKQGPQTKLFVIVLVSAVVGAFTLLAGSWQSAQADDGEWVGVVETMPAGGLTGEWTVRGRTFIADSGTEFRTEKGPLVVGACVEVEFASSAPTRASKIATKSSDDCAPGATPSASPSPGATPGITPSVTPSVTPSTTPTDDHDDDVKGRVEQMPASGLVGDWVIDGVAYTATASTRFRQQDGPLVIGACVEVKFSGSTAPFLAREIKTEEADECRGAPTATPTATPDGLERFGRIQAMPDGLVGDWVIDGVTYTATTATEFKPEHGAFALGACVKVHTTTATPPFTLREIETKRAFRCGGDDDGATPEGELFGVLQSFPAAFIGEWNVGGMTFVADANTEFKQERGLFTVGATVKVHFFIGPDGLNYAREIETKFANDDGNDDGNGVLEGAEGHAFGLIDQLPATRTGEWVISGVVYTATAQTRFEEDDGEFAVGVRVKVEYFLDAQGRRIARKIETTGDDGGASGAGRFVFFGFVRRLPPNSFRGEWQVDNATFVADAQTQFKEEHGLLGLGAFVKVEYFIKDGANQVHEIETHVPPGAGPHTALGVIDDKGGVLQAAGPTATVWVIGGRSYMVTPATALNDRQGELAVGKTALVNSYTADDGSQVATQIRGVTLDQVLFLPLVRR